MAADGGVEQRWPDLPGDLLSAVYRRSASAYDRTRFAAVCSPWRAAAAWQPWLPALPLPLLSTGDGKRDREARAYSPEDGRALRIPLPWFPWGNRLVGSYEGGWIATVSSSDEVLVVNLFSGARAALISGPTSGRKIVFSKDPLASDCIMAVMTSRGMVALGRVSYLDSGWKTTWCWDIVDIAFCNGELYGLTSSELIVFNVSVEEGGALGDIQVLCVDIAMSTLHTAEISSWVTYIFELHRNLAVAVEVGPSEFNGKKGCFFRVFELAKNNDTATSHKYAWMEVMSLGDHALFLGPAGCSKAVHVPTGCRRGKVEGNRIYYPDQHTYLHNNMKCLERLNIGSCTAHCLESERQTSLRKDRVTRILLPQGSGWR
ncbi:hypothetical protein ACQ4PT_001696 [Festuca glaucescens]